MPTLVTRGAASVRGFGFAGTSPVLPDPYFNYTTLLLHGNGTNGGQNNTFLDSGTANGGVGFDITRNGNTTQGTFSPFSVGAGTWSNYFNGSSYFTYADNAAFEFGSGNLTIEAWLFAPGTNVSDARIVNKWDGTGFTFFFQSSTSIRFVSTGASVDISGTISVGVWTHVAVTRSGSSWNLWINGVSAASTTASGTIPDNTADLVIGGTSNNAVTYLSNVRLVKGTAVYTSAFTPPTTPLTAISGTSLLICQDYRFRDASSNGFTPTITGTPSVQAFSPFAPTAAYSASTVGGSGYFDGSGDYLSVGSNAAFTLGTGDFTIECWYYPSVSYASGNGYLFDLGSNGTRIQLYLNTVYFLPVAGSSIQSAAGVGMSLGWHHVAAVRSGSTMTLYVDGVSAGTTTNSSNLTDTLCRIGSAGYTGDYFNGYISSFRIVKGTAVYTSAFTPPTAPLTNITNTSLLLNFTNAAIIDNTAKNVLETVADAQISTAQSKFGGASLYFDGTGDYLSIPNTPLLDIGSGDFTIEFWYYPLNTSSHGIFHNYNSDFQGIAITGNESSAGKIKILAGNGSWFVNLLSSGAATTNAWNHIAATRSGSTWTIWINGVSSGTATNSSTASFGTDPATIGRFTSGIPYAMNAYIDDFRITKGIARYTSNFTPQTSQWQDQ